MDRKIKIEIRTFLMSLMLVLAGIYLFDLAIGSCLKYLYKRQRSGLLYRTTYAIDSTKADYLVFGSSRANHHYNPHVFEQELNTSFYNCGRDAQGAIYSCALISAVLKRYSPKCIIIDIRPNEFTVSDEGELTALLPYHDNEVIKKYVNYNGPFENIKLLSHIYPYNSMLTTLMVGVSSFNKKRTEDYKGYIKLDGSGVSPVPADYTNSGSLDSTKIRVFSNLLALLDSSNVPALVVMSPFHFNYKGAVSIDLCRDLCQKYKSIKFFNFADSAICKQARYFKDDYHLNDEGARIFSEELIAPILSVQNTHSGNTAYVRQVVKNPA
jgi:hypothetical protein